MAPAATSAACRGSTAARHNASAVSHAATCAHAHPTRVSGTAVITEAKANIGPADSVIASHARHPPNSTRRKSAEPTNCATST